MCEMGLRGGTGLLGMHRYWFSCAGSAALLAIALGGCTDTENGSSASGSPAAVAVQSDPEADAWLEGMERELAAFRERGGVDGLDRLIAAMSNPPAGIQQPVRGSAVGFTAAMEQIIVVGKPARGAVAAFSEMGGHGLAGLDSASALDARLAALADMRASMVPLRDAWQTADETFRAAAAETGLSGEGLDEEVGRFRELMRPDETARSFESGLRLLDVSAERFELLRELYGAWSLNPASGTIQFEESVAPAFADRWDDIDTRFELAFDEAVTGVAPE